MFDFQSLVEDGDDPLETLSVLVEGGTSVGDVPDELPVKPLVKVLVQLRSLEELLLCSLCLWLTVLGSLPLPPGAVTFDLLLLILLKVAKLGKKQHVVFHEEPCLAEDAARPDGDRGPSCCLLCRQFLSCKFCICPLHGAMATCQNNTTKDFCCLVFAPWEVVED